MSQLKGLKQQQATPIEILVLNDSSQQEQQTARKSTIRITKKKRRKHSIMPTKAANQKLDSTSFSPSSQLRGSQQTLPKANNALSITDQSSFNLYKVVLQRVKLETWHSDSSQVDEDSNAVSVCYSQPESSAKSGSEKLLKTGLADLWSNLGGEENTLTGAEAENGHYMSIFERKPSGEQLKFDTKDSDEVESLKSFEMNELLNDISDDSINNEASSSDSVKDSNKLEKTVSTQVVTPLSLVDLENQTIFYERVEQSFYTELEKSLSTPRLNLSSSSQNSENYNNNISIKDLFELEFGSAHLSMYGTYNGSIVGGERRTFAAGADTSMLELDGSHCTVSEDRLEIVNLLNELVSAVDQRNVNSKETEEAGVCVKINNNKNENNENAAEIFKCGNHENKEEVYESDDMNNSVSIENKSQLTDELAALNKKLASLQTQPQQTIMSALHKPRSKLRRRRSMLSTSSSTVSSVVQSGSKQILTSLSPLKKRVRIGDYNLGSGDLTEEFLEDELNTYDENGDEDEFFLAITNDQLETGSCPDFYWFSKSGKL